MGQKAAAAALLLALLPASPARADAPPVLSRAHSHNDYEQARPLFDALDRGFFSVEADVHLRGRELFIGHTGGDIEPGRTLRSLYLDPLLARVRANKGVVYPGGPKGFMLLVEFKSEDVESYDVLKEQLAPYREMLTRFTCDETFPGAVTVVITGHRPDKVLAEESERWAAIDGDLGDWDSGHKTLYPVLSASWSSRFSWRGGPMSPTELSRLREDVRRAHSRGRRIRYWAIPDRPEAWGLLRGEGVDHINTDKLEELRRFLAPRIPDWLRKLMPWKGPIVVDARP